MNHELEQTVAELGTSMDSGTGRPASSIRVRTFRVVAVLVVVVVVLVVGLWLFWARLAGF